MAKIGETNIIQKITGKDEVRQRLTELGFVVGSEVTVITKIGGNLVLSVRDSRIGLDFEMAKRILI